MGPCISVSHSQLNDNTLYELQGLRQDGLSGVPDEDGS